MVDINSDVKLEKALDIMISELQQKEWIERCPLYLWILDFKTEVAEENIANLKTEIPVPKLNHDQCQKCLVKD